MTAPHAKRRWYQFSLLSLLVLMTVVAAGMGILVYQLRRYEERQAARARVVEIVNAYDGYVVEDQEFSFGKKGLKGDLLKTFLNDLQWWDELRSLHLEQFGVTDQNMMQLGKLRSLEGLNLKDTQITDEGLRELTGLTNLTWINIENCPVTNTGLKHLSNLSKLEYLEIEGTQITPAGKKWIKKILPNLKINPKFGNAGSTDEPRNWEVQHADRISPLLLPPSVPRRLC
jgi:hypothetical protein